MTPNGLVVASDQQGYAREKRNVYWCKLHQQAFDAVTDEWQSYYDLKEKTGLATTSSKIFGPLVMSIVDMCQRPTILVHKTGSSDISSVRLMSAIMNCLKR